MSVGFFSIVIISSYLSSNNYRRALSSLFLFDVNNNINLITNDTLFTQIVILLLIA